MPNREMKVQIARRTSSREFSISFWLQLANRVVCEFLVITLESCVCNYPFLTFFDVFWFYFEMDLYGTKRQAVVLLCTIEGGVWWRGYVNSCLSSQDGFRHVRKKFQQKLFSEKSVHEIIIRKINVFSFFEHAVTKIGSIPW